MESLRNVNQKVTLNFNLREPKKMNGQTQLYAVVKVNGKQLKLAIGCKLYAWQWNAKKQVPRITNNMVQTDIENVLKVNNVINEVRNVFFTYLCTSETITESGIKEIITSNNINDMANENAIPPKDTHRSITATRALKEAFESEFGKRENPKNNIKLSTWENYEKKLKYFLEYLEVSNVSDSIKILTPKGMHDYKEYLVKKAEKAIKEEKAAKEKNEENKKKNVGKNPSYFFEKISFICRLINVIADNRNYNPTFDKYIEKYNIKHVTPPQKPKSKGDVKRALTNEEIKTILECDFTTKAAKAKTQREREKYERLEVYKDVFQMIWESGVRRSDYEKLFAKEREDVFNIKGVEIQVITPQKEKIKQAEAPAYIVVNPTMKALQKKYADGLPFNFSISILNVKIKEICKFAGLNNLETVTVDENGKAEKVKKETWKIVSSHWGRYTLSKKLRKEGWNKDMIEFCRGDVPSNKSMVEHYGELTKEEIATLVANEYLRIEQKKKEETTNANGKEIFELGVINEFKDVLVYLGESYEDIAHINDIHELSKLVYDKHYRTIKEWGIKSDILKDTFQRKDLTLKERKELLNEMKRIAEQANEHIQAEKDISTI